MLGLATEWRFEKGDRKSYSGSSESEYKNKLAKAMINKSQGDSLCRMCRKVDESIDHIVNGCCKLAQKEYKRSHDNLGKILHWKLARKCNFEAGDKCYEHEPEGVLENEESCKISVFRLIMLWKLGDQIWLELIRRREVVR